ncbi:hypothetical protein POUND7_004323 [Theobroma cacao]
MELWREGLVLKDSSGRMLVSECGRNYSHLKKDKEYLAAVANRCLEGSHFSYLSTFWGQIIIMDAVCGYWFGVERYKTFMKDLASRLVQGPSVRGQSIGNLECQCKNCAWHSGGKKMSEVLLPEEF